MVLSLLRAGRYEPHSLSQVPLQRLSWTPNHWPRFRRNASNGPSIPVYLVINAKSRSCCLRGLPEECTFPRSAEEQTYISQSEYISQLEERCRSLERQLARLQGVQPSVIQDDNPLRDNVYGSPHREDGEGQGSVQDHSDGIDDSDEIPLPMECSAGAAVLDIFIERLIDDCCPLGKPETGLKLFILRDASLMRGQSELLQVAFENTALIFIGRTGGDRDIEMAGHRHNTYAIRLMRRALRRCSGKPVPLDVFVAAYIFIIREVGRQELNAPNPQLSLFQVLTGDSSALLKHLVGAAQLLQSRKPDEHRSGIAQAIFLDHRIYSIAGSILLRRPLFLLDSDWMTIPWGHQPKDMLHQLLDIGVQVPYYLFQTDKYRSELESGASDHEELRHGYSSPSAWAQALDNRLQRWYHESIVNYNHGAIQESPERLDTSFPIFSCHDPAGRIFTPPLLTYPDLLLTTVMCYYWALRITIAASSHLPTLLEQRYEWACNICRSLEAYIAKGPRCFIYRILYPVVVAYQVFERNSIERGFIDRLCRRLDEHYQVNVCWDLLAQAGEPIELPHEIVLSEVKLEGMVLIHDDAEMDCTVYNKDSPQLLADLHKSMALPIGRKSTPSAPGLLIIHPVANSYSDTNPDAMGKEDSAV
ncbi:uncharacterized protein BO97DRAFT_412049 [Aspergillus homomorphus CBS 101889]|uniref:C6 finger domain protein n=1 Tax=Aspergillus homomorphus (strain CBS 101889) TaxID=1450537 RepID=A0A395I3G1_ASPHC|nr:hypothetical protein BO97DRAFT_412049 [Aspergillus homomorphus CBS 101889]RAL14742.1 hypothetical protein BO97DRAFT_412049 [Aspergillus homomorphus CBS 101889]